MASTNTITQNTETIERVAPIFADKLLESVTLGLPGIQTIPATRDKFAMVTGSVSGMIQNYTDKPTANGTTSMVDQEFSISAKTIYHEILYSIFKDTKWKDAIADMKNQQLPEEFLSFILDQQAKVSSNRFEDEMWNGNGGLDDDLTDGTPSGATYVNGFAKIIKDKLTAASLTGQIITETTTGETPTDSTKVQGILNNMIEVLPKPLVAAKDKVRIFFSPLVEQALWDSYANQAVTNIRRDNTDFFGRYRTQVIPNLNDNRIIIGIPENLGIGSAFGEGNLMDLNVVDKYSLGDGNFAVLTANYGYGAGAATNDWVVFEYDPA